MVNTSGLSEELRREIGQHFVVGWPSKTVDEHITTLIRDYYVGNVIIFKRNIEGFEQIKALIAQLQQLAKDAGHERPLMIGIDQENGLVSAFNPLNGQCGTQLPGAMALAATGSSELAKETTTAAARELRAAGVNWAYSPVCDVNSDPRNPVIGVRSYGDDSSQVATFAAAVASGLVAGRIAPSLKHFPGHGDTHVDSHAALPVIRKTRDDLLATELPPFAALLKLGLAPTVMTGHMALPLVDTAFPDAPCSLSHAVTTDLLRGVLGFEGVVVTDCLEMDAVSATYGCAEGSVRALEAGADIVMICHRLDRQTAGLEAAYAALAGGRLDERGLSVSGQRVAGLKDRFAHHSPSDSEEDWNTLKAAHATLSASAYDRIVAVYANQSLLPLARDGIVVVTPEMTALNPAVDAPRPADGVLLTADGALRNTAGPSYLAFARALGTTTHIVCTRLRASSSTSILGDAKSVVFATRNASDARSAWQLDRLAEVVAAVGPDVKVVVVSTCTPYDLPDIARVAPKAAILATFEFTAEAMQAAARVIFGDVQPTGRVPVRLGD